jgi:IS5 family transposase
MERESKQLTFLDDITSDLGGKRTAVFFAKCDQYIPWEMLAEPLKDMYSNDTSKGGASNWPVVMMIKCMMLQKWFNLSDPMLEEMLSDRISFRRFVGLTMNDKTPDETVFVVFRRRLREHGHSSTLFDKTVEILKQRGLILEEGTCVDATIIEAPRGQKRPDGSSTKDPSASYTKKHGRSFHGFKAHIATDTNGIIKDYRFDTAKVHDSQHIDDLIASETHSVYADSAYMDAKRKADLESRGVFCGIVERRVRGQKELTAAQKWHNRLVAGFRAVVEHPFAWMKNTGYRRCRYRGLSRNGLDFTLHAIAYNFKRSFSLQACQA